MRLRWMLIAVVVLGCTGSVWAQESPDQLRKERDDALNQLKYIQDGKNKLATDNQKLQARIDEQAKKIEQLQAANDQLMRDAMEFAEKTYFLTSQYAAWQAFMSRYPQVRHWWETYLSASLTTNPQVPALESLNDEWPFLAPGTTDASPASTQPAASQPTTAP